jgi:hypothetical protein
MRKGITCIVRLGVLARSAGSVAASTDAISGLKSAVV